MRSKKESLYIFLDTNIYLPFPAFNQLPWESIFANAAIKIVLSYTVLKELEKSNFSINLNFLLIYYKKFTQKLIYLVHNWLLKHNV